MDKVPLRNDPKKQTKEKENRTTKCEDEDGKTETKSRISSSDYRGWEKFDVVNTQGICNAIQKVTIMPEQRMAFFKVSRIKSLLFRRRRARMWTRRRRIREKRRVRSRS